MKYIGRYLGRPVIATSRIDKYDGENVTFHYNRHEDDVYVEETLPALEFIERLIRHIPEKHFKMIRYYGLYARSRTQDKTFAAPLAGNIGIILYQTVTGVIVLLFLSVMILYSVHAVRRP